MKPFIFLDTHSVYSLSEGTIFLSDIAAYAAAHKFEYLALSDTNGFYGIVRFLELCREYQLKPLISVRIKHHSFSALLIARNQKGYALISDFISALHLQKLPDPWYSLFLNNNQDYFIITADQDFLKNRKQLDDRQPQNYYAEINVLEADYWSLYQFASSHKIRPVLIYPVYFLKKEGYHLHALQRAIYYNKKLTALEQSETVNVSAAFLSVSDIHYKYSFMEDAISNTYNIAQQAYFDFPIGKLIFPRYCSNSFEKLKKICYSHIPRRYHQSTPQIEKRLDKELKIIRDKGFADYFLIVYDIVCQAPYTCGRGSAAASIVSYLLFITHVDPIRHNLFFERFLNIARMDPPDIDVDFPWDTRDDLLDYIFNKYTEKYAAMVSNHITFSVRSSVREIAKVYGIPEKNITAVTKNIGYYYNRDYDKIEKYSAYKAVDDEWELVYRDAAALNSMPRFLSVHCGGVVITPHPITSYIPVERSTKGVNIIQLEKDQTEDFGLVKIDILGNRSLAVVRDTLALVREHYGREIPYKDLNPIDDPATIKMLANGETMGVFYVESPAMRQLQKKTRKGDYEHLVIHSSIIRPAANLFITEYIKRLRGKPYQTLLPEMQDLLQETYGIMCYQEDITKVAMAVADFSIAEAEELRKVISKKSKLKRKLELKDLFYRNTAARKIPIEKTEKIWQMIESFSGYSFCKPHSASYALLSFKCCYLKAHYPAEFIGAVLKNQGGFYTALAYISEARRMNLKIVLPDVNQSRYEYFGKKDTVYIGFMQIKNLSTVIAKKIAVEREKLGLYTGFFNFIKRIGITYADLMILIKAGCFRSLVSYNQPQLLFLAQRYYQEHYTSTKVSKAQSLLAGSEIFDLDAENAIRPPPLRDLSPQQKLSNEMLSFGSFFSIHPMHYYKHRIKEKKVIPAADIVQYTGRHIITSGILITSKTIITKFNDLMKFVSFEDETAIIETVFFPEVYKKYALQLLYQRAFLIYGKVEQEFETISICVNRIRMI